MRTTPGSTHALKGTEVSPRAQSPREERELDEQGVRTGLTRPAVAAGPGAGLDSDPGPCRSGCRGVWWPPDLASSHLYFRHLLLSAHKPLAAALVCVLDTLRLWPEAGLGGR